MRVMEMLAGAVSAVMPKKSLEKVIEEQNTTTVWYPRVHGFPRKYVYGKRPGEPLLKHKFNPEGEKRPFPKGETVLTLEDFAITGAATRVNATFEVVTEGNVQKLRMTRRQKGLAIILR